jgi:hypothetical protein
MDAWTWHGLANEKRLRYTFFGLLHLGETQMFIGRAMWTSCILAWWGASTVVAASSDVADAAKRGDKAAVRTLLAQKADVNARQPDGDTALHWAAWRDDVELATLLLRAGANANPANLTGATPLQLASVNGNAAMIEFFSRPASIPTRRCLNIAIRPSC